jgi:type VI protein secretion system component VasK
LYVEFGKSKTWAFITTFIINVFCWCIILQILIELSKPLVVSKDGWFFLCLILFSFSICAFIERKLVAGLRKRLEEKQRLRMGKTKEDYYFDKDWQLEADEDEDEDEVSFDDEEVDEDDNEEHRVGRK